jgi:hypothetical protein
MYKIPPSNIMTTTKIAPMFLKNDSPKLVPLKAVTPLSAVDDKNPPVRDAPFTLASFIAESAFENLSIYLFDIFIDSNYNMDR